MLTITVDSAEVNDVLVRLSTFLSDPTPAMRGIGATLKARVSARFETETDPFGNPWAKWADGTQKTYPHPGSASAQWFGGAGNGRILDRFGDMLKGVSWEADARSTIVGFDQQYAQYHEFGAPGNNMPRRGLLMGDPVAGTLSPADEKVVLDELSDFLRKVSS